MFYYYLTHRDLKRGDLIQPGEWGRLIRAMPNHRYYKMELQFDLVRTSINPLLPSRLNSIFLFDLFEMALRFQKLQRQNDNLYKVKIIHPDMPKHIADMMLVHPELEQWDAQWGNPKSYWTSINIDTTILRETLTVSPVEVMSKINNDYKPSNGVKD